MANFLVYTDKKKEPSFYETEPVEHCEDNKKRKKYEKKLKNFLIKDHFQEVQKTLIFHIFGYIIDGKIRFFILFYPRNNKKIIWLKKN